MLDCPVHFVSGLPRSGSTLLVNLLGQNPGLHVTPMNDLIEHVVQARNTWMTFAGFRSQGLGNVKPRILGMLKGMFRGFYAPELAAGRTILDNSRAWLAYIELVEEVFERKVKLLVTVRAVEDTVASFEKLHRLYPLTKPPPQQPFAFKSQTVQGRAEEVLSPGGVIGVTVNRLRDALHRKLMDRLILVPYRQLTMRPREVAAAVGAALGLPAHNYNPEQVEHLTQEDDTVHGMPLHRIRSKVEPETACAWQDVLPDSLATTIARDYPDINALAAGPVLGV